MMRTSIQEFVPEPVSRERSRPRPAIDPASAVWSRRRIDEETSSSFTALSGVDFPVAVDSKLPQRVVEQGEQLSRSLRLDPFGQSIDDRRDLVRGGILIEMECRDGAEAGGDLAE